MTLNSREAIAKARAAYDALLEDQKQYVSEEILKILTDAEAEYARLESLVLKNITLDKTEVNMKKERVTLHVTYDPEDTISDKTIIWNVADPSVATVENGTVTAVGGGETAVSAHVGMLTATCTLKSGSSAGETYIYRKQRDAEKGRESYVKSTAPPGRFECSGQHPLSQC